MRHRNDSEALPALVFVRPDELDHLPWWEEHTTDGSEERQQQQLRYRRVWNNVQFVGMDWDMKDTGEDL